MRRKPLKFYLTGLGVSLLTLFVLTACGENAISTPAVFSPVPDLNSETGNSPVSASSPEVNQMLTAGGSAAQSGGEKTTSPQSVAIQMAVDPISLKVGDSVTITGNGGQTPVLGYTLLLNSKEFAKDNSSPRKEGAGNDSKQVFKFVSASRKGNGVTFVLKAAQPGKVTVSLKASSEASYSAGGKPISVLFTTVSNLTDLTVVP
ncbi:MAG TPA: hypothetical protein VH186_34815 [Chloroflexia bacterium]|nr:hypothetical protein [Chloroflexia bacterium]